MDLFHAIESSLNTGTLLPSMYNYPSVSYYLALSRIAPDIFLSIKDVLSSDINYRSPVRKAILTPTTDRLTINSFILQVRGLFAAVTLLSVVWTYLLVLLWRKNRLEAFTAAVLLGSSWEVSYHARWIAPDGILMQFCILTILLLFISMESEVRGRFWLRIAACSAGISCGTKYFGGVMLLPVLLTQAYYQYGIRENVNKDNREYFVLIIFFCIAFLVTTPGALLQPVYFVYEVLKQIAIYKSGWWGGTVRGGIEHFFLDIKYFMLVFFSKHWPISLFFSVMIPVGTYTLCKENLFKACIFFSGPLIWLFYESGQDLMCVRNILLLGPFAAVLSSVGVASFVKYFKNPIFKGILISVVLLCLAVNSAWLYKATHTIRDRFTIDHARNTYEHIRENSGRMFFLSKGIRDLLTGYNVDSLPNVSRKLSRGQEYIFQSREPFMLKLQGNRHGRYKIISGAADVNFDYYPLWEEPKVVSVPIKEALSMEIIDQGL